MSWLSLLLMLGAAAVAVARCPAGGWAAAAAAAATKTQQVAPPAHSFQQEDLSLSTRRLQQQDYNPRLVDWAGVVSACKAIGRYEKRMANFIIRAGFHDSMAINTTCLRSKPSPPTLCGGADGSALLAEAELKRNESMHRTYLRRASRAILPVAERYGSSIADTLAVCGMVMPSTLGAANMLDLAPLRVGRRDSNVPNPDGGLLAAESDVPAFRDYWRARRLTLDDGIALIGIHVLMEGKGCVKVGGNTTVAAGGEEDAAAAAAAEVTASGAVSPAHTYSKGSLPTCNPLDPAKPTSEPAAIPGSCPQVQMFLLNNQFYIDLMTPSVSITPFKLDVGLKDLNEATYIENLKDIACSFSSNEFRRVGLQEAVDERGGHIEHWPDGGWLTHNTTGIVWGTNGCRSKAKDKLVQANCNHLTYWPYTRLDGHIAAASQKQRTTLEKQVAGLVREYMNSNSQWQADYGKSFAKMMSAVANWSPQSFFPTFRECTKPYVRFGTKDTEACDACNPPRSFQTNARKAAQALAAGSSKPPSGCPADCVCPSSYGPKEALQVDHCGAVC